MEETHICSTTVHIACFQKRAWGLFLGWEKAQQCAATFAVQTHQQELYFYSLAHIHSMITVTSNWHLAYVFYYSPSRKGTFFLFLFIHIFAEYGECRLKTCISTETINTSLQLYQMWGCACSFGCNWTGRVSCQAQLKVIFPEQDSNIVTVPCSTALKLTTSLLSVQFHKLHVILRYLFPTQSERRMDTDCHRTSDPYFILCMILFIPSFPFPSYNDILQVFWKSAFCFSCQQGWGWSIEDKRLELCHTGELSAC